ncbi:hypothetical protein O181_113752 [Austropuccinia psidii MF-1]|uniref:Integrase catalytic domain-containing protein n=1 Tax=Austropuccinia psidii MF-1 TaxID=1389203 RepID=A0A9Q3K690_9BASI|nr:hypothetical protein [Austropuccinia psidii MF-1]
MTALTSLLKKDSPFIFNEEALSQFQVLKEAFTTAPILSHFNPSLPTIVETDASDYALGAVLSQVNHSGKNPIAFGSCKLLPAELNYEIHDKELLGIVWALQRWGAFLLSLSNSFEVLTDHSSLQYFMSSKFLTCCQALWAEFLSEFHFTITYCPGRLATLPDALSHQDGMYPERGVDFISKNPQNFHKVIKQDGIQESIFFSIKAEIFSDLVDKIQKELWQDNDYKEILKQLGRGKSVPDYSLEPQAKLLLFKDRAIIPSNEELQLNILQKCHDSSLAGHPGQEKTLNLIKRDFYWAGMNQFIKGNVSSSQIFISHVFSKHGLPVSIISDRGSLLVSSFWTQLYQQLKISRDLSTAFHPETDGQTERVNSIPEQYLWINPTFNSIHICQDSPAGNLSTKLQSVQKVFKEELESEIMILKKYADRNRALPPDLQPGDKVWLASKNIKTTRPTKKLSERGLGPFEVLKKIGSHAYNFKLPQKWESVHPVFHVSLLEPVKHSTIPNQHQLPTPTVLVEEQEEWEVAQVLDSKLKRGKLWYLV